MNCLPVCLLSGYFTSMPTMTTSGDQPRDCTGEAGVRIGQGARDVLSGVTERGPLLGKEWSGGSDRDRRRMRAVAGGGLVVVSMWPWLVGPFWYLVVFWGMLHAGRTRFSGFLARSSGLRC